MRNRSLRCLVPRRTRSFISVTLLCLICLAPACTRITRHFSGGSGVKARVGTLTITPPAGKAGVPFALAAAGFRPGEAMTFEVDIPGRPPFIGPSHVADAQGLVASTYVPLAGDPPGAYMVKAVGNQGTKAQATLTVTG
jgi:hypothetical protein